MKKILMFLAAMMACLPLIGGNSRKVLESFRNPDDAYRPYVRWWWNGDKIEESEIRRELPWRSPGKRMRMTLESRRSPGSAMNG